MKKTKLLIIKRIFVLFCSTLLLTTNIFLSYNTAVHAAHDYDVIDAAKDVLNICIVIGGLIFAPATDGLSLLATTQNILGLRDSVENLRDYITDNGDGTYTIDESLIQAALQAAEELEAQGFSDSDMKYMGNYLYNYKWSVVETYMYNHALSNTVQSKRNVYNISAEILGRVAGYKSIESSQSSNGRSQTRIVCIANTINNTISGRGKVVCSTNGNITSQSNNSSSTALYILTLNDGSQPGDSFSGDISFGGNFPIFSDNESMKNYLNTGQGYKDALNYRPTPLFRRHSSYTPTYSGGAVTVNRTVINNITNKITEVDADDSLSDDQKIEILQQYILSGGTSGTGGGGSGGYPGDTDYDDNKDLPSGTDLSDTNSWLKKIYLKICQIYAKMNSAVEDTEDAALAKIQESLDEIITQLKKIKHWAAVDTVIDGVDAIADWLDLIRGVISDADEGVGSAVTTVAESLADSADSLSTKFPFSIPWDILFFISVLAAEPQVPYFEIPMDIEMEWLDINIHYDFVIDFSQFQWLSDLSRLVLSMTYAVGLLKLTMNIALLKKEE